MATAKKASAKSAKAGQLDRSTEPGPGQAAKSAKADKAATKANASNKTAARPSTRTGGVRSAVVPESGNPKDANHPDIDDSRHLSSGLQEVTTTGVGAEQSPNASSNAQKGSGLVPPSIDPQPSIGANRQADDHQEAPVDPNAETFDEDGKKLPPPKAVTNYAVADALPEIMKGDKGYSQTHHKDSISFKDKDRRTMLVVKTADGKFAKVAKEVK